MNNFWFSREVWLPFIALSLNFQALLERSAAILLSHVIPSRMAYLLQSACLELLE